MTYDPSSHGAACAQCPLRNKIPVPPSPPASGKLRLVVIGEGPGRTEEKLGEPFVGLSGKFLDERLRKDAHVSRGDCHLTNAALCRGETDKENARAAECCAPRLLSEIAALPPEGPIVTLGASATRSVLGARNVMVARGFVWTAPEVPESRIKAARKTPLKEKTLRLRQGLFGRTVFPMLHPAFILRADVWKPVAEIDFRRLRKYLENPSAPLEHVAVHKIGGPELLNALLFGAESVACDIETDGIDVMTTQILSVGVSTGAMTVELWPWTDDWGPAFAEWMAARREVIFHNGANFDTIVLQNHGAGW